MTRTVLRTLLLAGVTAGAAGCQHPSVTAVSLNPHVCDHKFAFLYDPCKEPEGIPFYLPKPLLIISKNFRNIEETKVGLTAGAPIPNGFDKQETYADLNSRSSFSYSDSTNAPGGANPGGSAADTPGPSGSDDNGSATAASAMTYSATKPNVTPEKVASDGLTPDVFYTYQIIFIPDMTQKYGLKIRGGVGEIRAAMNLVNGWQFTGLGPFYMKDSSTAQNTLATGIAANLTGRGVANVVSSIADLQKKLGGGVAGSGSAPAMSVSEANQVIKTVRELNPVRLEPLQGYAQISVWEPILGPDGQMEWREITNQSFARELIGGLREETTTTTNLKGASAPPGGVPNAASAQAVAPAGDTAPSRPIEPPQGGGQLPQPNLPAPNIPPPGRPGGAASGPAGFNDRPVVGQTLQRSQADDATILLGGDPELERSIVSGVLGVPNPTAMAALGGATAGGQATTPGNSNQLSVTQYFGKGPHVIGSLLAPLWHPFASRGHKHEKAESRIETRQVLGGVSGAGGVLGSGVGATPGVVATAAFPLQLNTIVAPNGVGAAPAPSRQASRERGALGVKPALSGSLPPLPDPDSTPVQR